MSVARAPKCDFYIEYRQKSAFSVLDWSLVTPFSFILFDGQQSGVMHRCLTLWMINKSQQIDSILVRMVEGSKVACQVDACRLQSIKRSW
jgi:hypothetical protein